MREKNADQLFQQGEYIQAASRLEEGFKKQGEKSEDALLYLLDIGLSYHSAREYSKSSELFLRADKVAEIKDYTSLSDEGASFLTSDNVKDYKGEDFEKVLISTFLAINFAAEGKLESALVECRRVNRKLLRMKQEGGRNYHQSAFARYLSATLYEASREYNDARIDYEEVARLRPDFPGIGADLWRMAFALRMNDYQQRYQKRFGLEEKAWQKEVKKIVDRSQMSELVVIYENGISPRKKPNPHFRTLPKFYPRSNPVEYAQIRVDELERGRTFVLDNIEEMAIRNLDEKYGSLVAKKVGGVIAKEVAAHSIARATDNPFLGLMAKLFFYLSDQADVRSWNLLPRDLQIYRVQLPPGEHVLEVIPVGRTASESFSAKEPLQVNLSPGEVKFISFRYTPPL